MHYTLGFHLVVTIKVGNRAKVVCAPQQQLQEGLSGVYMTSRHRHRISGNGRKLMLVISQGDL